MRTPDDIVYIGVDDHAIDLFEGQYAVPNGMAYNSYVVLDDRIAVLDTVDARFTQAWLDNLRAALNGRSPDYLIVQHMEPDHSAGIRAFAQAYPQAVVAASAKAFAMMKNYYGMDFSDRRSVLTDAFTLSLGRHTLSFLTAPMVHWPEVVMTYDALSGTLFSADAFGKFGALDREEPWAGEARRYYIGIVGKYGAQVQALLRKAAPLDIRTICPLHGPVLTPPLDAYLRLYQTWSSYAPEEKGVVVAYTSVYGHTAEAASCLAEALRARGCTAEVYDLARCDMHEAVAAAFRYDRLALATTTYNADVFPFMRAYLEHLCARNFQRRTVALMENGSWAPTAAKAMCAMLAGCKQLTFVEPVVTLCPALNAQAREQIDALAEALAQGGEA